MHCESWDTWITRMSFWIIARPRDKSERLSVLAAELVDHRPDVIVTFGHLGTRRYHGALWPECWGRSYALCGECWDTVRQIAQGRRPGLVITEASGPPPQFCAPVSSTPDPR